MPFSFSLSFFNKLDDFFHLLFFCTFSHSCTQSHRGGSSNQCKYRNLFHTLDSLIRHDKNRVELIFDRSYMPMLFYTHMFVCGQYVFSSISTLFPVHPKVCIELIRTYQATTHKLSEPLLKISYLINISRIHFLLSIFLGFSFLFFCFLSLSQLTFCPIHKFFNILFLFILIFYCS